MRSSIKEARLQRVQHNISETSYQAWRSQHNNAIRRGLEFRFDLLSWAKWWETELAKIGPHAKRGHLKGEYMMCRHGDKGGYEPDNVYAGTPSQNMSEQHLVESKSARMKQWLQDNGCHLTGKTGFDHPKSRPVVTENGTIYGSIALAAEAYGITRAGGFYRIQRNFWKYADQS